MARVDIKHLVGWWPDLRADSADADSEEEIYQKVDRRRPHGHAALIPEYNQEDQPAYQAKNSPAIPGRPIPIDAKPLEMIQVLV